MALFSSEPCGKPLFDESGKVKKEGAIKFLSF